MTPLSRKDTLTSCQVDEPSMATKSSVSSKRVMITRKSHAAGSTRQSIYTSQDGENSDTNRTLFHGITPFNDEGKDIYFFPIHCFKSTHARLRIHRVNALFLPAIRRDLS